MMWEKIFFWLFYPFAWLLLRLKWKRKSFTLKREDYWKGILENPADQSQELISEESEEVEFSGFDDLGNFIFVQFHLNLKEKWKIARLILELKGVTYELNSNRFQVFNNPESTIFECDGLRLEIREPFKRWRITFRGYLRNSENGHEDYVRLQGWWANSSDPLHFASHIHPRSIAEALSSNPLRLWGLVKSCLNSRRIDQAGQYTSLININSEFQLETVFRGRKSRRFRVPLELCKGTEIASYNKDGSCINWMELHLDYNLQFAFGYKLAPNGTFHSLASSSFGTNFESLFQKMNSTTNELSYKISNVSDHTEIIKWLPKDDGYIVVKEWNKDASMRSFPILKKNRVHFSEWSCSSDLLPLGHIAAQNPSFVGGKAANLSLLCSLQEKVWSKQRKMKQMEKFIQFRVPKGLVLTTCFGTELKEYHKEKLTRELKGMFGSNWEKMAFAVRSSGLNEDSAESSSAGQLRTLLNLKGREQIMNGVVACWESNQSSEVEEYRRQHGEQLAPSMGVIIQEMIDPDFAGVLFTNDPITGDTKLCLINASPGLGEAVVDGSITPDNIKVELRVGCDASVESDSEKPCINAETALKLAKVGKEVEAAFGRPQDIEWAIKDGTIYILQTRPITSLNLETSWELLHEFDTGLASSELDFATTANLGEVYPEEVTPLVATNMSLDKVMQAQAAGERGEADIHPYQNPVAIVFQNRFLFNMTNLIYANTCHDPDTSILEISFFGHPVEDPRPKAAAARRFPAIVGWKKFRRIALLFYRGIFWKGIRDIEELRNRYVRNPFPDSTDPRFILEEIVRRAQPACDLLLLHCELSGYSTGFGIGVAAGVLESAKTSRAAEIMADIATLYSCCQNVVSAGVPSGLKNIAAEILRSGREEEFTTLNSDDGLKWLLDSNVGLQSFLIDFGHRCPQEADIGRSTWGDDPRPLVDILQKMVRTPESLEKEKEEMSVEESIARLRTPLGGIQKAILRYFLPKARAAVANREQTKNLIVYVNDAWFRKSYRRIGSILTENGILPDEKLVFYFTHSELKDIIERRGMPISTLINRAVRRRKELQQRVSHPLKYPEIMRGTPKPIDVEELLRGGEKSLKGTPACSGVVRGIARVAKNLKAASHIKAGEILITTSTDIGWSPYFPVISGIVTELGGLLSHGAVIAREYGLPCLIGVTGATEIFSTGDHIVLDATKGIIYVES